MFAAVIVGNVIAALFAFLGVGQVICYLSAEARPVGAAAFMFGLSVAAWPLAVAVVIYLLVQIACWLEKLYFAAGKNDSSTQKETLGHSSAAASTPRFSKKDEVEGDDVSAAPVFFKATPPPPAHDGEMDVKSAAAFAAAMDSARHAEEDEQKIVAPVGDDWDNEAPTMPEKTKSGLNFFKID